MTVLFVYLVNRTQGTGNFNFCENMTRKEIQNEDLFVSSYWPPCVVRTVKSMRPTQMVVACEYYDAYTKYIPSKYNNEN